MGIEAFGETLEELFVHAACALRTVVLGEVQGEAERSEAVELRADGPEALMVDWLSEVLFLLESRGLCPLEFHIESIDDEARLKASVKGVDFRPGEHSIEREVKAVTWHRLEVAPHEQGWRAVVYLDL